MDAQVFQKKGLDQNKKIFSVSYRNSVVWTSAIRKQKSTGFFGRFAAQHLSATLPKLDRKQLQTQT